MKNDIKGGRKLLPYLRAELLLLFHVQSFHVPAPSTLIKPNKKIWFDAFLFFLWHPPQSWTLFFLPISPMIWRPAFVFLIYTSHCLCIYRLVRWFFVYPRNVIGPLFFVFVLYLLCSLLNKQKKDGKKNKSKNPILQHVSLMSEALSLSAKSFVASLII